MTPLLDIGGLAAKFKKSKRTVLRWIHLGCLPPETVRLGQTRYWDEEYLEDWLRSPSNRKTIRPRRSRMSRR